MIENEKMFNFMDFAIKHEASDLFLITGSKPALKINGDVAVVNNYPELKKEEIENFLIEIMSKEEKKFFETSSDIDFGYTYKENNRFRINALVTRKGVGIVARLIFNKIKTLKELGIPSALEKVTNLPNGLVLVTGAVGSGKSATLASIINIINKQKRQHIITVEDPIEFYHENNLSIISQREVGSHTRSFASGLRGALREAVDVILVGELRDAETMELAITAAETGCLVFGTMHTRGVVNTANRIIGAFGPNKQSQVRIQLADNLKCVLWQTLIKTKDEKSRVPATELMFWNHAISNMIRKKETYQIQSVLETSKASGMGTMKQSLEKLFAEGKISENYILKYR